MGHLVAVLAATADETIHERHHVGLFAVVITVHQSVLH
jgi:hypothetical protein